MSIREITKRILVIFQNATFMRMVCVWMGLFSLCACTHHTANSIDPYETVNRKIYAFNKAVDATVLERPAKFYKSVVPEPIRTAINNAYENVNLVPTVANDLLQADRTHTIQDSWRFIVNSTFGLAGFLDVASTMGLPPHSNDLGLTFAKWGNTDSPFIVLPFLGPSTIRDSFGLLFDYALFSPYRYVPSDPIIYGILGFRYIDVRSQLLDADKLIAESLDPYTFIRDAYLQHRRFTNNQAATPDDESLYVEESN